MTNCDRCGAEINPLGDQGISDDGELLCGACLLVFPKNGATYFCVHRRLELTKHDMEMECCLDVSQQHCEAPKGPCVNLVSVIVAAVEKQCPSYHYHGGDNVKCVLERDHGGWHVGRDSRGTYVAWGGAGK